LLTKPPGFLAMSSVLWLHRSMRAVVDDELKISCRLRLIDYQILKALHNTDAGTHLLSEVARQLLEHATTVSIASDRLAERDLVTRQAHPTDRRATLVIITEEGRKVADAATDALSRVNFGLTNMTPAQAKALTDIIAGVRTKHVTPD
jgi:DNA-binding MarR family transcriptional regulator